MPTLLLYALLAATAAAFPTWGASGARRRRQPSGILAPSSPRPSSLPAPLLGAGNLTGALFYGTCNLPACSTLEFASWGLANGTRTDLFDFPLDSFDDGYVADNALFLDTVVISLQSDSAPDTGALVTFNLTTNALISSLKTTPCFALWPHPDAPAAALLCLALVGAKDARCPAGTTDQCTLLLRVDRGTGAETLVAGLLAGYAPFTVECLDTAQGAIYSTFELLNGGLPQMVAIDARSGAVLRTVPFPVALAFLELEYSVARGRVFAVVEDGTGAKPVAFAGAVDVVTATATPLGPGSYFNVSYPPAVGGFFNQFVSGRRHPSPPSSPGPRGPAAHATHSHAHTHARTPQNTISTLSDELGVFFSTAFHYEVPGPPPSDPILYLIANSLDTGELVYVQEVINPFCEILWLPSSVAQARKHY